MALDCRETLKADAARQELRDERREILEQWLNTELRRFVNAMDMTEDAYDAIKGAIYGQALDERVI